MTKDNQLRLNQEVMNESIFKWWLWKYERYAMTPCEPADSDKEDVKYGL
jgi:hypothetical protein